MDNVRFGRALGKGTRAAAKSLWEAADAAASPAPARAAQPQHRATEPVRAASAQPLRQAPGRRAARTGLFAPLRKFSGVLWLEVTGSFFGLFAAFMAEGAWKLRAAVHAPAGSPDLRKLWMHVALFLLFGYFAVSSFVRARRRERRT